MLSFSYVLKAISQHSGLNYFVYAQQRKMGKASFYCASMNISSHLKDIKRWNHSRSTTDQIKCKLVLKIIKS